MNKTEIDNLIKIIENQYPHICLSYVDYSQILIIPRIKRNFYYTYSTANYKKGIVGWLNNGKTMVWSSYFIIQPGRIKIAEDYPRSLEEGWLDAEFNLSELNISEKINKMIKLKAFW